MQVSIYLDYLFFNFSHFGSMSASKERIPFKTYLENYECPILPPSLLLDQPEPAPQMGYALTKRQAPTILNESQKSYLQEIFDSGQTSKNKKNEVSKTNFKIGKLHM